MPRVKTSTTEAKKHRKILKQAKGYRGARHLLFKTAKEAVEKAGKYAYRDRKVRKREFRKLWIMRINAAVREHEMSYSKFINGLAKANVLIDRKVLADLALFNKDAFKVLVEKAKTAING